MVTRRGFLQSGSASFLAATLPGMSRAADDGDVLVIGAGLSGLHATGLLEESGYKVRLLEATNRIGGRLYTVPESEVPGHPELGGSGIGEHDVRIRYVAEARSIKLVEKRRRTNPLSGDLIYHLCGETIQLQEWANHPLNSFPADAGRELALHLQQFAVASRYGNPLPVGDLEAWQTDRFQAADVTGLRSDGGSVTVFTRAGKTFRARFCICTLPFSALRHVALDPPLEGLQAEAVSELGYTPVFQVHFLPTRKYWELDGLPLSMWTDRAPGRFMALKNNPSDPDEVTSCLAFVKRIYFAGEHTAVMNRGMEGTMESAERTALEVMERLG